MKLSKEIIDIIESKKINIEEIKTKYEELIDCFRMKVWLKKDVRFDKKTYREILTDSDNFIDERAYDLISIPWKYLTSNEISFISPAFNFNQLISTYRRYLEKLDVHFPDSHIEFYEFFCAIHTCLISIKSGIDRLVKLFSYYFNDIPKNITFGHVKQNGKYTNFL